jgi:glycosyltransferase involved in cell wall biosynthesis
MKEICAVAASLVYPRVVTLTTQLTTPLEPPKALAMQTAVLASSVPTMRELVSEPETGLPFEPGNPMDVADKALSLLDDASLRNWVGLAGRSRLLEERRWEVLLHRYAPI